MQACSRSSSLNNPEAFIAADIGIAVTSVSRAVAKLRYFYYFMTALDLLPPAEGVVYQGGSTNSSRLDRMIEVVRMRAEVPSAFNTCSSSNQSMSCQLMT